MTRICPHCHQEKQARGFSVHEAVCEQKKKNGQLRKRYASNLATMTPEQSEKFLRKAQLSK